MSSMPTRIEIELFEAAQSAGAVMSRSATQQINHWVRLGREFESAQGISQRDVASVLAGRKSYDRLNALEQVAVRVEWDERTTAAREGLSLVAEFETAGESWVEAEVSGTKVVREPAKKAAKRKATTKRSPKSAR